MSKPKLTLAKNYYLSRVIQALVSVILILLLLFAVAGRLNYWQGWVFVVSCIIFMGIMSLSFRKKSELIEERAKPGPGVKGWDKVILKIYNSLVILTLLIGSLDGGRFEISQVSSWLWVLSYLIFNCSLALIYWSMWTNRFFSTNVRIQNDRGHSVIQTGPYSIIRHPGYLGMITMWLSAAPLLGSMLALLPASLVMVVLIKRTSLEDKVLQKELGGYKAYTQKVRYRVIPGFW